MSNLAAPLGDGHTLLSDEDRAGLLQRHSRISADLFIASLGRDAFSWGSNLGVSTEQLRQRYLAALRAADADEIDELRGQETRLRDQLADS